MCSVLFPKLRCAMKTDSLKKVYEKIKSDKKILLIVLLGLSGCFLLGVSQMFSSSDSSSLSSSADIQWLELEEKTAGRLEELLKEVDGVGKVEVFVSLESLTESVYAVNRDYSQNEDKSDGNEEYVIVEEDGEDKGLVIKTLMPVYRGVAVSCEGGGSSVVKNEVTKLVTAALGINANRVYVTKMNK